MNALVVEGMEANPAMRDPRDWAKDCRALAAVETDLEAQSAFNQLAEEFEAVALKLPLIFSREGNRLSYSDLRRGWSFSPRPPIVLFPLGLSARQIRPEWASLTFA